jgi:hypothetical protein
VCHQSVGLVANTLEGAGMSTVEVTLKPDVTHGTGTARSVRVRFPMGNPVGEPHKPNQQRRILRSVLEVMQQVQEPGLIVELPYRWRRMKVEERHD